MPGDVPLSRIGEESEKSEITQIAISNGLTLETLRLAAGDDWEEIVNDLELAGSFANVIATRSMRERGKVPPDYTSTTICQRCGFVPIWSGAPKRVLACPWCFNRLKSLPVPKPLVPASK